MRKTVNAEGQISTANIINDIYLLLTADGIYTINAKDQEVNLIYSSTSETGPLISMSIDNTEAHSLMLLEHENNFRLFKTGQIDATRGGETEEGEAEKTQIYIPDTLISEFSKPEYLNSHEPFKIAYLENSGQLILATKEVVSPYADTTDTFQVFELNQNGTISGETQYASSLFNPPAPTDFWSGAILAAFVPGMIVVYFFTQIAVIELFSTDLSGTLLYLVMYGLGGVMKVVLFPLAGALIATILGQWYCRRKQVSAKQRRLMLWITILFGPLGLISYWLVEQQPHRVVCKNCEKLTTAEKFSCQKCGQTLVANTPRSTDIISTELSLEKTAGIVTPEPQTVL
ncbi:MAG: hypothetical protein R3C11_22200 [Planctomycetaceae bacterium]